MRARQEGLGQGAPRGGVSDTTVYSTLVCAQALSHTTHPGLGRHGLTINPGESPACHSAEGAVLQHVVPAGQTDGPHVLAVPDCLLKPQEGNVVGAAHPGPEPLGPKPAVDDDLLHWDVGGHLSRLVSPGAAHPH